MNDDASPPPQSWIDSLDRAQDDLRQGRVVTAREIHAMLEATIAGMAADAENLARTDLDA